MEGGTFFFLGLENSSSHAEWALKKAVRAFLLFSNLAKDSQTLKANLQEVSQRAKNLGIDPLIFGIDQEGGVVRRLKEPEIEFPSAFALASLGDEGTIEEVAWLTGSYLKEHGVDLNLAPVADTLFWPEDEGIATRSFGTDARVVAKMALSYLKGLFKAGILGAAKHFPGHGHALEDTHTSKAKAPSDDGFMERFKKGLLPFKRLIARGVPVVIPAHVCYATLGERLPATFSPYLLKGLLRERIGYRGLIISDDLLMKAALSAFQGDIAEVAIQAFLAGCDLLTIGPNQDMQALAIEGFSRAIRLGRIPKDRLEEAYGRFEGLASWVLKNRAFKPNSSFSLSQMRLATARRLAQEIIRVYDPNHTLPFKISPKETVTIVENEESSILSKAFTDKGFKTQSLGFDRAMDVVGQESPFIVRLGSPPSLSEAYRFLGKVKNLRINGAILSSGMIHSPLPNYEAWAFVFAGSLTPIVMDAALSRLFRAV
jgi:beta-N-acetylhexosaminidase